MSSTPRNLPRFLPTLTEVVMKPTALTVPRQPVHTTEQIIDRVMARLDVSLESRVKQTLDTVVLEQIDALEMRLRDELQQVLRDAVTEAVSLQLEAAKQKTE